MTNLFSKIVQSPEFIAVNAHCWFAAFLVLAGVPWWLVLAIAALKEFFVDVRYENNPPQTYADGAEDFAGYALGVAFGVLTLHLLTRHII